MRKYWRNQCDYHLNFSIEDIKEIEKKFDILVIPHLLERETQKLFYQNYKRMGFDRIGFEPSCFERIYKRKGYRVDFKGVDVIAWRANEPYTVELETWASFARFHDTMFELDYIVCLQKDNWYGGYGDVIVIELWKVLGLREIILREELESFLYENSPKFQGFYDELTLRLLERGWRQTDDMCKARGLMYK